MVIGHVLCASLGDRQKRREEKIVSLLQHGMCVHVQERKSLLQHGICVYVQERKREMQRQV
jgi:hypothetical protein